MERALEQIRDAQRFFQAQNRRQRIENPIRDFGNPMEAYTSYEFRRKFRFSKTVVFHVILPLVIETLKSPHGAYLSPLLQLLVALRWFASNSFQHVVSDTIQISQPSVCRIVATVARCLASLRTRFINFPTDEQAERVKRQFFKIGGFPGVIGCIDGTHIKIEKPSVEDPEVYRNRKGYFSINVQAVCNADLLFTNVVARWHGSVYDSRIMENSRLVYNLRTGNAPVGHLLGDGGYTGSKYLLIPYQERELHTEAEKRYNKAHIKTRNCIERAFGVLKKRFYCLSTGLRTKMKNTLPIIVACFVLHNIAILQKDQLEPQEDGNHDNQDDDDNDDEILAQQNARGNVYRRAFTQAHFYRPEDDDDIN